jgi:outer membrane protein assembly factor BamB
MIKRKHAIITPACLGILMTLLILATLQPVISLADDVTLKWSYQTGWFADNSSPAIGPDGTIYVGSADSYLYAFGPDGKPQQIFQTPIYHDRLDNPVAIGQDGTIYIVGNQTLYALNPTGAITWQYEMGSYSLSCPAIGADGTIYVGTVDGVLYAISPGGAFKWSYAAGNDRSSPAVGPDGTIYIGAQSGYLYAVNPNGSFKWSKPTGIADSSPAIGADGTIYVGGGPYLYAFKPDGTQKWRYLAGNVSGGMVYSSPAIGPDGTIYVGCYNIYFYTSDLCAVDPAGNEKWKYATGGTFYSSPAIGADGTIYVGSQDHHLYAIKADGALRWVYPTAGSISYSSPAIGPDGTVYVGDSDGWVYAINSSSKGLAASPWPMFHRDLRHTGRKPGDVPAINSLLLLD